MISRKGLSAVARHMSQPKSTPHAATMNYSLVRLISSAAEENTSRFCLVKCAVRVLYPPATNAVVALALRTQKRDRRFAAAVLSQTSFQTDSVVAALWCPPAKNAVVMSYKVVRTHHSLHMSAVEHHTYHLIQPFAAVHQAALP